MTERNVDRTTRDAIFEQISRVGHAVSNPTRLKLLSLLMQGEKPVELLAERCEQTVVNVSAHLRVLREAHLVTTTRAGRQVRYRVESRAVEQLFVALRTVAESQLPEMRELVEAYERERETLSQCRGQELLARVRAGTVLLVDLRPEDEFAQDHLPGACSIPFAELSRRMAELPDDREIVAYCRGPYCVMGVEGVKLMRQRGKRASRLADGVLEWRAQNLPLSQLTTRGNT
jgi:rhodanese-related sulfurtransferase